MVIFIVQHQSYVSHSVIFSDTYVDSSWLFCMLLFSSTAVNCPLLMLLFSSTPVNCQLYSFISSSHVISILYSSFSMPLPHWLYGHLCWLSLCLYFCMTLLVDVLYWFHLRAWVVLSSCFQSKFSLSVKNIALCISTWMQCYCSHCTGHKWFVVLFMYLYICSKL